MGFTRSERDVKIIQKLSDYPNVEEGISSEKLKESFDKGSVILQEDLNKLVQELEKENSAEMLGSKPLSDDDLTGNTIYDKLIYLLTQIKETVAGQIADGSITENKLETVFRNLLAKKDNTLQSGLNSEKIGGKTLQEILDIKPYYTGTYTGNAANTDKDTIQTIALDFTPSAVLIKASEGNIDESYFATLEAPQRASTSTSETNIYLQIVENGFTVKNGSSYPNWKDHIFNFIAFK